MLVVCAGGAGASRCGARRLVGGEAIGALPSRRRPGLRPGPGLRGGAPGGLVLVFAGGEAGRPPIAEPDPGAAAFHVKHPSTSILILEGQQPCTCVLDPRLPQPGRLAAAVGAWHGALARRKRMGAACAGRRFTRNIPVWSTSPDAARGPPGAGVAGHGCPGAVRRFGTVVFHVKRCSAQGDCMALPGRRWGPLVSCST